MRKQLLGMGTLNGEQAYAADVASDAMIDGFDMTITDFFDTDVFRTLEQEMY